MMPGSKFSKYTMQASYILRINDPPRYEHKREALASRYAKSGRIVKSATHVTIRMASFP